MLLAEEWFEAMKGRSVKSFDSTLERLEDDILPTLGKRPIGEIEPDVLEVVRRLKAKILLRWHWEARTPSCRFAERAPRNAQLGLSSLFVLR
jgi:hypothetical protein